MLFKLSIAVILPLALFFTMSNVFLRASRGENNIVMVQNRMSAHLSGRWTIDVPAGADKARLQLQQGNDSLSVHVPLAQFTGLNASALRSEVSNTGFQLARDTGTFTFNGSFQSGRGSGEWSFKGNSAFVSDMRKHGYDQLTEENLYRLALNNITASYIGELAQAGYRNLPVNALISLYSNNVRADYINGLAATGYAKLSPNDLIALKSNGVTETYIKSLQGRGHKNLSVQQILSIRTNSGN